MAAMQNVTAHISLTLANGRLAAIAATFYAAPAGKPAWRRQWNGGAGTAVAPLAELLVNAVLNAMEHTNECTDDTDQ